MNNNLKIVLVLDNVNRELEYLLELRDTLKKVMGSNVYIIGSIAEFQYVKYFLWKIQPQLIVISQVFEKSCRDLVKYAKDSGSIIAILPSEVRSSKAYYHLVESGLTFDNLIDLLFLPGNNLAQVFYKTKINKKKIHITGSPKIDISLKEKSLSKLSFIKKYGLEKHKKNIFLFTSFVYTNEKFLKSDPLFKKHLQFKNRFNTCAKKTKKHYESLVSKMSADFPECNIIIKPHPLENTKYKFNQKNVYVLREPSIKDCLKSIDLAIHWASTVALECWINNIPTIEYYPTPNQKEFLPDFIKGNPIYFNSKQMKNAIKKYLKKPLEKKYLNFQKKYLLEAFYKLDGNSNKRIAKILKKEMEVSPNVYYIEDNSFFIRIFIYAEKLFGFKRMRKIMKYLYPKYDSKYAEKNFYNEYTSP